MTLPRDVAEALRIRERDEVEFAIDADGEVVLRGLTVVPADQAWFWEDSWQEGEREASAQIAEGDVEEYDDVDSMFDALNGGR